MNGESEHARLALLGIPFDGNSSFMKGPAEAPPLIRAAFRSESWNLCTEEGVDLDADGLIWDTGDLALGGGNPEQEIERRVCALVDQGMRPIALGGDHSITAPIVRAFHRKHGPVSILHLDAHPDLYEEFQGSRSSHASPFARIMEEGLARRLVQVGIRTMNEPQRRQAERYSVEVVQMRDWPRKPQMHFEGPVYVSVDVDVLDPAFAPGVSHHEPGGCSVRELLELLQALRGQVVGADIVEFNPRRDPLGITAMVCAKILKELAGAMLSGVAPKP